MADPRDAELDIVANDKTGLGTRSAAQNFDRLKRKVNEVDDSQKKLTKTSHGLSKATAGVGASLVGAATQIRAAGPVLAVGAIATALLALPAAGSLAAGGLVTAMGGGLAALGILVASKNAQVRKEFDKTFDYIKQQAPKLAAPFVPVLIDLARRVKDTFNFFAPALQGAFKDMGLDIQAFLGYVQLGFQELRPAIKPVTDAFGAILNQLGPSLPGIFNNLAKAITNVSNSISSNPQTFASLVTALLNISIAALNVVAALSRVANWFQRHPNVTKSLVAGLTSATTAVILFRDTIVNGFNSVNRAIGTLVAAFGSKIASMLRIAASAADAIGLDSAAKKMRSTADSVQRTAQDIQRSLNSINSRTVSVTVKYQYMVNGRVTSRRPANAFTPVALSGGPSLSPVLGRGEGFNSTEPPAQPIVNVAAPTVNTTVSLDFDSMMRGFRSIVKEEVKAAQWSTRNGRR